MRSVIRWIILVVVILGLGSAIVWALLPQPVPVDVAAVVVDEMQWTVIEEGRTRIRDRFDISAPLAGRLRRITLDPGDPVLADETIVARIAPTDPSLLDARSQAEAEARVHAAEAVVQRALAGLEKARQALDFAEDELARVREARAGNGASVREVESAEHDLRTRGEEYRAAEFDVEIARFDQKLAEAALLRTTGSGEVDETTFDIRAPITGCVLRVLQKSVAVVTPGTPLLVLGDPTDLEIVIDVLSVDAVRIKPGARVIIDHWGGGHTLEAVVRRVEPSGFTKVSALGIEEQRVNVIADFTSAADERPTLADGFRVDAGIVLWQADDVLQIPSSAAFRDGAGWAVFVVVDGKARLRSVELGTQDGGVSEVLSGLTEGEIVIAHPSARVIQDGRVEVRSVLDFTQSD